jgi:hypothetical protein
MFPSVRCEVGYGIFVGRIVVPRDHALAIDKGKFSMAITPPPTPLDTQLLAATRQAACASLAGGMIAASGRPWSLKEAMELMNHVHFTIFPSPAHGSYQSWQKDADRLVRVYK